MLRKAALIFFFFLGLLCHGNAIDSIQQETEKPTKLDNIKFENSIRKQEQIIHNPNSSSYDICKAYYAKYIIYKELFNYDQALENLDLVLQYGLLTDKKDLIRVQYRLEKLLVYFDLLEYDKVNELLAEFSDDDLQYLKPSSLSFYWLVVARMEIRKGNTDKADEFLNNALATLLEHEPEQVPLVYRKKIELYKSLGLHDKVIESFETGMSYAKKYKTEAYELGLYDDMANYYAETDDIQNPKYAEAVRKVKILSTAFDGTNRSSKLLKVEKELLEKRKELEVANEKRNRNFLITLTTVLVMVLVLLYYFLKAAKQKRLIAELEANNMRNELESLTESEQNKIDSETNKFTERQLQIIDLVKQGKSNKEIGETLFISVNTVKYHLKIIYDILDISNRKEL